MFDDWDNNSSVGIPFFYANVANIPRESQRLDISEFPELGRGGTGKSRGSYIKNNYRNCHSNNGSDRVDNRNRSEEPNKCSNEVEVLNVPSRLVGRIIGRGGSTLHKLQIESGARIHVTKDTNGEDTVVKLFGDQKAITKVKELITTVQFIDMPKNIPGVSSKEEELDWKIILKECEEAEKAEWAKYPPIIKDFYVEHEQVSRMSEKIVEKFREDNNNIIVERTFRTYNSLPIPKPCPSFNHAFHNYPDILSEIEKAGFSKPSPIQAQAFPVLLSGEDLIGIAQTGTGKTLAFLLPALIHIEGQTKQREFRDGPAVLIMAPIRELALQIDKEIKKYQYKGITSICLYGGGDRRQQVKALAKGVDIVIATPGRLNDLVAAEHLSVKTVTYVVLDEADRMLDMGFEPQIRKIMYAIRPTRQTIMTSATWPLGVRRLAESYMNDPIQVYIGSLDLAATHTVTQVIQLIPDDDDVKMNTFMDFARNIGQDQKVIVFCGMKARADDLASELAISGIKCQTIHGNREQSDREQALADITDGTVQLLIATDVASRGLDIMDITHVINYDFPKNIEEYVHRVGRTGRAGKSGESISYFTRSDWAHAKELISILEKAHQYVPDELYKMAERYGARKEKKNSRGGGRGRCGGGKFGGRRW